MQTFRKCLLSLGSILVAGTLISACAPTKQILDNYSLTGDISGLTQDERVLPSLLYYREGAPSLAEYTSFVIDPIDINLNDNNSTLSDEELEEAKSYFYSAMSQALSEGGYEVSQTEKQGALRISFIISNLSAPNSLINVASMAASLPFSPSVGSVSVEAIFRESVTNKINAVYVEKSRGSMIFNPSPFSTLSDIEAVFDNWASGFRESVDQAHGKQ